MRYKSPPRKLKSRCSVCGIRCVGKICSGCFRKHYWTMARRKEMAEKACRVSFRHSGGWKDKGDKKEVGVPDGR